jgi:ribulose bisphosphate carboxylase small subunit
MTKVIPAIFILLRCFTNCHAQAINDSVNAVFVHELEREIYSASFNNTFFEDTVVFELKDKVVFVSERKEKEEKWGSVKALFKNTDYVINLYSVKEDKILGKLSKWAACYELKNHKHIYIIGIDEKRKVFLVHEVKLHKPALHNKTE